MKKALVALAIGLSSTMTMRAMYVMAELANIPIDRIIANLTKIAERSPNDAEAQLNLGRAHAMAWSLGNESVEADRAGTSIWFGYEPKHVPMAARRDTPDARASEHLERAIEHHRRAAELDPDDLTMQLGYAWCLDQAKRSEAVPLYRRIIAEGWKREGTMTSAGLGFHSVTAEAAGYLLPHLDSVADAAEISDLRQKSAQLLALPRPITPIVVPLDDVAEGRHSGDDIVDRSAAVRFDLDGSGRAQTWQWITQRYGWLVYDHDGSGRIDSALQLFGSVTFWMFWENGYRALSALDDDGNGELSGRELLGLALWVDANGDGVSDRGEVRSLDEHGIVAVSCAFRRDRRPDLAATSPHGVRLRDGRVRPTFDVILSPAALSLTLRLAPVR